MLSGVILPGEQWFNKEHWANDILNECHYDDCIWGYTICIVEELCTRGPAVFTNGVLFNLMRMGVNNWTKENAQGNQSTQAMRLVTALASWIIRITNTNQAKGVKDYQDSASSFEDIDEHEGLEEFAEGSENGKFLLQTTWVPVLPVWWI